MALLFIKMTKRMRVRRNFPYQIYDLYDGAGQARDLNRPTLRRKMSELVPQTGNEVKRATFFFSYVDRAASKFFSLVGLTQASEKSFGVREFLGRRVAGTIAVPFEPLLFAICCESAKLG